MREQWHLPMARLVVFPHSGSGPSSLQRLMDRLPAWVDLRGVVLPGREHRIDEDPRTRLDTVLESVDRELADLPAVPTVLFGHSLGALLAALMAVRAPGRVTGVVLSAQPPIAVDPVGDVLTVAGLTPAELLDAPEWRSRLDALLQADGELAAEARQSLAGTRIPVRTRVLGGTGDPLVPARSLDAWRSHARTVPRLFDGGHFYLIEDAVVGAVADELTSVLRNAAAGVEAWTG